MKKKDDFCRESNHFLKSVCLALCLISSGGSAVYAATLQTEQTTLTVRMNNCTIKDVFDHIDFDLSKPKGKTVETLINGRKAQYVEPLKTGDVLDIFWKD